MTVQIPVAAVLALLVVPAPSFAADAAYTDLALDACAILGEDPGREVALRCDGLGGVPVFLTEGDLRFDVDFGAPDGRFDTFSPFNTVGSRVEWRTENDVPFAAILRFAIDPATMEADEPPVGSVLGIFKVGGTDTPGCPVGYIDAAANVEANEMARQIADAYARSFRCGTDRATYVGVLGPLSGDATATLPDRN